MSMGFHEFTQASCCATRDAAPDETGQSNEATAAWLPAVLRLNRKSDLNWLRRVSVDDRVAYNIERNRKAADERYLPIDPASGLYLYRVGLPKEERVCRVFEDTWLWFPEQARELMLRKLLGSVVEGMVSPWIFLSREIHGIGDYNPYFHRLRLHPDAVAHMADRTLAILIAHELTHVYLEGGGEETSSLVQAARQRAEQGEAWASEFLANEEYRTQAQCMAFGFDEGVVSNWLRRNRHRFPSLCKPGQTSPVEI